MHMEVGIDLQSLMGSKMKSWTIHIQKGVLEAIGSDVPNLMKDVPRVRKCVLRCGSQSLCYRFLNEIMDHPC